MYLVMKLQRWDKVKLEQSDNYRLPFPVHMEQRQGGSVGFCEVYENREDAIREHGEDVVLAQIEFVPLKEETVK